MSPAKGSRVLRFLSEGKSLRPESLHPIVGFMASIVHLICGEDEYAVSSKAKEIVDAVLPPAERPLGLEIVDGAADTVEVAYQAASTCMAALQTLGFLGGQKVVWFRNVSFLADTVVGRSEAVKARVEALAELISHGVPEGTVLVVSAPKADKRFAFYKACKAKGEVHEFAVVDKPWQAGNQIRERACELLAEKGLRMEDDALETFVVRVGADGRQMASELEKLAVFSGKGEPIRRGDVVELTSSSRSVLAWDLTDAFGRKKLGLALETLRRLVFQKESPIGLVILLHSRIRDLMVYREALDKGWLHERKGYRGTSYEWASLPAEAETRFAQEFGKDPRATHPFRVGVLAGQARLFSQKDLRRCQLATADAHRKLVSSRVPQPMVLELLLVQLLA